MSKKAKQKKRVTNSSKYVLTLASSNDDLTRFESGYHKMIFSNSIVRDKNNLRTFIELDKKIQRESNIPESGKRFFETAMANPNENIVFISSKETGIDIGFAVIRINNDGSARIQAFTVYKHLVGRGRVFYNKLETFLKESGISTINIRVPYDGAQIFWTKMGFKQDESSIEAIIREEFFKFI